MRGPPPSRSPVRRKPPGDLLSLSRVSPSLDTVLQVIATHVPKCGARWRRTSPQARILNVQLQSQRTEAFGPLLEEWAAAKCPNHHPGLRPEPRRRSSLVPEGRSESADRSAVWFER